MNGTVTIGRGWYTGCLWADRQRHGGLDQLAAGGRGRPDRECGPEQGEAGLRCPGNLGPGYADDASNPDRLSVPQATINYETQGKTHTLRNVSATMHESGSNQVMTISERPISSRRAHGTLNIATSQPLVINSDTGVMSSGALNITGSDGGVVTDRGIGRVGR
jgi:hypothetical protein